MKHIVQFPDKPFCYVPRDHEGFLLVCAFVHRIRPKGVVCVAVVRIINKNSARLNLVLSDTDLMEGGVYYRIDSEIISRVSTRNSLVSYPL